MSKESIDLRNQQNEEYYWDIANATALGKYLFSTELKYIYKGMNEPNNDNIVLLDIGSGSGRFSVPLFQKGIHIIALDNDLPPLQKLREKENNISLAHADGCILPFKSDVFDYVLGIEVFSYVSNKESFLKEIYRVLKNDGHLLITASNRVSYKGFCYRLLGKYKETFYRVSYREILKLLYTIGFTTENAWGYQWPPVGRASNNKLIPLYSTLEKGLRLSRFPYISPWVFIVTKKKSQNIKN